MTPALLRSTLILLAVLTGAPSAFAARQMERLGRGVVALRQDDHTVFVSWRILGTEAADLAFNLYRITDAGTPQRVNAAPLLVSNFVDANAAAPFSVNAVGVIDNLLIALAIEFILICGY